VPRLAVIAGIGETAITPPGSGRPSDTMTLESARAACLDAGIEPSRIDAIVKYTYDGSLSGMALAATLGCAEINALVEIPMGGGSSAALVDIARMLVESGRAQAVLCFRTLAGEEWLKQMITADPLRPYYLDGSNYLRESGWTGYLHSFAALYAEYDSRHHLSRETLFRSANALRANAAKNKVAIATTPLSRDEYFDESARTVGPFTRFDEYAVADLSCAAVVTAQGFTDRPDREVRIIASAQSHGPSAKTWFDLRPLTNTYPESPSSWVARKIYAEAKIEPRQVDVALMYDCTSFTVLDLVETYQLCEPGGVAELLADDAFRADGTRPVNTHGGDFAAGYSAGFRHVLEATRQLRWEADNQVPEAEFAVVAAPQIGPTSGAVLQRSAG
jgi:17-hydroxy-3-oxo-4-pregnene-20-carboxyl-CoA lyase